MKIFQPTSKEIIREFNKMEGVVDWSAIKGQTLKQAVPPYGLVDVIDSRNKTPDVITILKALKAMGYSYPQLARFAGIKNYVTILEWLKNKRKPQRANAERAHIMLLKKYRKIKSMIPPLGRRLYKL